MATDPLDGLDGYAPVSPELPQVRIIRLEPGDMLLVNVPQRLTDAEFVELSARMKNAYPGHECAVLDGGATLDVLRRERAEAGER